jgi:hypothetical protein
MIRGDHWRRHSDVLTPFEDCIADELTRGNPDTAAAQAALRYARRAARLAAMLHEVLDREAIAMSWPEIVAMRDVMERAKLILDEESEAARRGE